MTVGNESKIEALSTHVAPARTVGGVIAWTVFFAGVLYYCFAYLLRVFPSVMMQDLQMHFHVNAAQFGTITAFYYYAYAPMQLPVGMIVDFSGARRALLIACTISILGVYIFAHADHMWSAESGRFLIGFGAAFGYVTVLKLATLWLPQTFFATATGIATAAGMISAVFTDMYLTRLVQSEGYLNAIYFCLLVGLVLWVLIALVVRDKPSESYSKPTTTRPSRLTVKQLFSHLRVVAQNPQMWLIGLIGALMYLPASVFLDVWGIPYLKAVYLLTPEEAALAISVMLFGWIGASPITGILSDRLKTRRGIVLVTALVAFCISSLIFFVPGVPKSALFILLFGLGASCGSHHLCFTLSKENNEHQMAATSVSFANCLIMVGGVLFQPLVGVLLDLQWHGGLAQGLRVYTPSEYTHALALLPFALLFGGLLSFFLVDTYQRTVDKRAAEKSVSR